MTNALVITAPEGMPWIEFTREFDAPVGALFNAHRDPDLVRRWLGPNGYEMTIDHYDFVSGGCYRYVHHAPDGGEYAFRGTFHTVREDEFAIQTFEFEGAPDQVAIEYLWFEDLGSGRSRLRGKSIGPSVESRDAMIASGMEKGMREGYERLEALCA